MKVFVNATSVRLGGGITVIRNLLPALVGVDEDRNEYTVVARSDPRGSRDLDARKARVAVDVRRISRRTRERPRSARVHGNVDARELCGDDRVAGRVLEGRVARDGRDADKLAVPGRSEDREHVVVARIAIQEQSLSGHEVILLA